MVFSVLFQVHGIFQFLPELAEAKACLAGVQNPNSPVHAMASMAWGIHGMVHPKSQACQGKMPALVLLKFFPQSEGMCVGLGVAQHCLHLEKWPIQNCECNDAGQAKPKRVTTQKAVPGCL